MRSAEQVLGIIQERGKRGLPLEDLYRQLYNPNLYLKAYGKIYRNAGAMTKGATTETVDGMALSKIKAIIDGRFLRLIETLLQAGYLEEWRYHATLSGCPQGSILSPVLANIYLDKLDTFVETELFPAYTRGRGHRRRTDPAYASLQARARRLRRAGQWKQARQHRRQMQQLPSLDPTDPGYRRMHYLRYADDWLIGFIGPRNEAEEIKQRLKEFLQDTLKLTLSETKTLLTHARSERARFLGYEIAVEHDDHKHDRRGHRSINGQIGLRVPKRVIRAKCRPYLQRGKPIHLRERIDDSVYTIIAQFQQEYRGLVEYYQLAVNCSQLKRLKWVMEQSLTKTLAHKLRISVPQVYKRYGTMLETPEGRRKGLQVVVERGEGKKPLIARWGGISLARRSMAILNDQLPFAWSQRSELEKRLLADTCELCGSHEHVEVHHIRALKDLQPRGRAAKPTWVTIMAARHRKTLITCRTCHDDIHAGRADGHYLLE